jgi:hypothetical protein
LTLKTFLERNKAVDKEEFLKLLKNPAFLFNNSKFVKKVSEINNLVEINFLWTKMHITKQFAVLMKIYKDENSILYSSVPDSRFEFKLAVTLQNLYRGNLKITVEAEMGAGLLADLMGEKDFKEFINNLIDNAIDKYLKKEIGTLEITTNNEQPEKDESMIPMDQVTSNEKFTKFRDTLPQEIIIMLNRGLWENANSELTLLLCKRNDDLNLWLLKSFLCEKLNRKDLALKYLQYVTEKNPKIIDGEFGRALSEDSALLKFINPMSTK